MTPCYVCQPVWFNANKFTIGYHVEVKANNGEDWQLCEVIDTSVTKATVNGVQKGIEYQFRVVAISKAGKSEPSLPSRPKEARAQKRKSL